MDANMIMGAWDTDYDNKLWEEEWGGEDQGAKEFFHSMDLDGSDYIDKYELATILFMDQVHFIKTDEDGNRKDNIGDLYANGKPMTKWQTYQMAKRHIKQMEVLHFSKKPVAAYDQMLQIEEVPEEYQGMFRFADEN